MEDETRPPQATAPPRRPRLAAVWVASLTTAALMTAVGMVERVWSPMQVPPKGSVARYNIRARQDAVYDLHDTVAAEAREAKQAYVPIYIKDNQLLFEYRERIVKTVLAESATLWEWADRGPAGHADGGPETGPEVMGPPAPPDAGGRDSRAGRAFDGGLDSGGLAPAPGVEVEQERRREMEALVRGCFRLLIPYYKDGVVGDSEFPKEKETVRIFSRGRYVFRQVSELHRFSDLEPMLRKSAGQFFFKTNPKLLRQVIDYVLQRLPPNLSYAEENERFIADISQVTGVKMVLIRRGDILVKRGSVVDTRAYYAIRAGISAARDATTFALVVARFGLLISLVFVVVVATRTYCPSTFVSLRPYLVIYVGLLVLAVFGETVLVYLPLHTVVIPQAALALVMAVVIGRGGGLLTGLAVPAALVMTNVFDLTTLLVGASGGVTAALAVRRRRRGSALVAGVLVGVVQAVVFEACCRLEGRRQVADELWTATEAFGGGLLSGGLAVVVLPFVEWLLGRSSRGKLKLLTDFDHPLVRELRERAPGTFAHTVNLINMVEMATDAVGGDRLLARAGTLFHDVGKMVHPQYFVENQGQGPNIHDDLPPDKSAEVILGHVTEGQKIGRKHGLPPDVAAFIPEHHGTTELEFFLKKARDAGLEPAPADYSYPGPKPQSVETAILMIADSVEAASRTLQRPTVDALNRLVDRIVLKKFAEQQFDECGITQGELRRVKASFVAYLGGALHRRVKYPSQEEEPAAEGESSAEKQPADEEDSPRE